jgi:hypothetical protein
VLVLPNKSAQVWDKFITENKVLVYKYILRELNRNLTTTNERIELFKFEDESMFAWIPRRKVLDTLDEALKIFVKAEEYEYAQRTKDLMIKYQVDKLIKESNKPEE